MTALDTRDERPLAPRPIRTHMIHVMGTWIKRKTSWTSSEFSLIGSMPGVGHVMPQEKDVVTVITLDWGRSRTISLRHPAEVVGERTSPLRHSTAVSSRATLALTRSRG